MMAPNVFITLRRRGKKVRRVETHNVWPRSGQQYLAELIGFGGTQAAPVAERSDRLKYIGFGIGGVNADPAAFAEPFLGAYPVGSADLSWPPEFVSSGSTTGAQYDSRYPELPRLGTLERPVRRRGGSAPYPGDTLDRWYVEPPNFFVTHRSTTDATCRAIIAASSGDYVYGSFTQVPLTEAGLFTSATVLAGVPYQTLVGYVTFDTILLDADTDVELVWQVKFDETI